MRHEMVELAVITSAAPKLIHVFVVKRGWYGLARASAKQGGPIAIVITIYSGTLPCEHNGHGDKRVEKTTHVGVLVPIQSDFHARPGIIDVANEANQHLLVSGLTKANFLQRLVLILLTPFRC